MRPEYLIADLETVRIVADPTRMRILELLVIEPQPVKSLAAALKLPQTKLYYHINLLEERGLIRVTGTRVVSGIIEKRYAAAARSYRIDDELLRLAPPDGDDSVGLMLGTLFDSVKQDVRQGLAAGMFELRDDAPAERKVILGRSPLRLTPARAAELHDRIAAIFQEYCPDPAAPGEPEPGARLYHLFVAYFPSSIGDERPGQE